MIRRHLIDGDGNGNKLEAVVKGGFVEFVNIAIVHRDQEHRRGIDVRNRHMVRMPVAVYLALADVIRMEES